MIGHDNLAYGGAGNSVIIGSNNRSNAAHGIAIGQNAVSGQPAGGTLQYENTMSIGTNTRSYSTDTIAIGNNAVAGNTDPSLTSYDGNGLAAMALGSAAKSTSHHTVAVGADSKATAINATAVGNAANASANSAVAVGDSAQATSVGALATGAAAKATDQYTIAVGNSANASGLRSMAVGYGAVASDSGAMALGRTAKATSSYAIAQGYETTASGGSSTAIGYQTNAYGARSIAIGREAVSGAASSGADTIAIGTSANTQAVNAISIGNTATTDLSANNSIALGSSAKANVAGSVAIGSGSTTTRATDTTSQGWNNQDKTWTSWLSTKGNEGTTSGGVWNSTAGVVSVGTDGSTGTTVTRKITGVAAGQYDTDAVNMKQWTNTMLATAGDFQVSGSTQYGSDGTPRTATKLLNESLKITGGVDRTLYEQSDFATNPNIGAFISDNQVTLRLNKKLTGLESIALTDSDGNRTAVNGKGVYITPKIGRQVTLTTGGLNNGGNKITNVAAGVAGTDAVNVDQLKSTIKNEINNINIGSGTTTNVTVQGGTAAGTDSYAGKNLQLKQTTATDGTKTYDLKLADNLDLSTSGSVTTGNTVVNNDGVKVGDTAVTKDGLTIKNGPSVTTEGINAGSKQITNVANGVADSDAVNVSQLTGAKTEITNNLTTKGLDFTADNGTTVHRDLGQTLGIVGDGQNITTTTNPKDGKITVALSNTVSVGTKGSKDGSLTVNGADGSSVVINGADGSLTLNSGSNSPVTIKGGTSANDVNGNAVNRITVGDQTVATLNDGMVYSGDTGSAAVKLNKTVNVAGGQTDVTKLSSGKNIGVVAAQNGDNGKLTVQLAKDITDLNSVTAGEAVLGNQTKNTAGGKTQTGSYVTGLDNKTWNMTNPDIVSGRGATEDQLKTVSDAVKSISDGTSENATGGFGLADGNGVAVKQDLGKTITVKGGATKGTVTTENANGVSNITTSVKEGALEVSLNKDIDLGTNGSVTTGNTVVNNDGVKVGDIAVTKDGLTIKNGPSVTTEGINAGNKQITNVASGSDGVDTDNKPTYNNLTNAANIGDVKNIANTAVDGAKTEITNDLTTKGLDFTADNGATVHRDLGQTLGIVGDGQNITTTTNPEDGEITVAMSDNVALGSKGATDTTGTDGSLTVNGKDGSSVVINGSDGSIALNTGSNSPIIIKGGTSANDVTGSPVNRITVGDQTVATLNDGMKYGGDFGTVSNVKLNNQVDVKGEATTEANLTKGNIGVVSSQAGNNGLLTVKLNKDVDLGSTGSVTIGDTVINNSGVTIGSGDSTVKLTDEGLNNGGKTITNVAEGVKGTDAVNVDQLNKAVKDAGGSKTNVTVEGGTKAPTNGTYTTGNLQITATEGTGETTYDLKLANNLNLGTNGSVTMGDTIVNNSGLTITGGPSVTTGGISAGNKQITNVASGSDGKDANNKPTYNTDTNAANIGDVKNITNNAKDELTNKGLDFTADSGEKVHRNLGEALGIVGDGKNITTTTDPDNGKISVGLSNDLSIGTKGENGKDGSIGVNGKDGSSVVINGKDGSIGLTGPTGTDGTPGKTITIKGLDGKNGVNGVDGSTVDRIVVNDQTVATLNDGQKYAGDNGQTDTTKVIAKKLNEQLDIVGGADADKLTENNIGVNNVNGKLKVQLVKDVDLGENGSVTTGNTVVNNDGVKVGKTTLTESGLTIDNGPSVTNSGIDAGSKQIIHVASGSDGVDADNKPTYNTDTNAANIGDVKNITNNAKDELTNKGLDFTADNGETVHRNLGEALGIVGDGKNITTTTDPDNGKISVGLSNELSIGTKGENGKDGSIGINGKDGSSVVINGKDGIFIKGADGKDGVTINGKDGVDGVDGLEGHIGLNGKDGVTDIWTTPGQPGLNGKDGESMTRIIYKDPDGQNHEVATLDDGMKYTGDTGSVAVKLNKTVNVAGGQTDATQLSSGKNIGVVASQDGDNGKLTIQLAKDVTDLNTVTAGTAVLGNQTATRASKTTETGSYVTGLGNKSWNIEKPDIASGRAATEDQLKVVSDSITAISTGIGGFGLTDDKGNDVKQTLGQTITVKGGATEGTVTTEKTKGVSNITTAVKDGALEISLNKDLDLGTTGSVTTGNTVVNNDGVKVGNTTVTESGLTINNGPSVTNSGINAGNKQIANVASGSDGVDANNNPTYNNLTNAANIGDVKNITNNAKDELANKGLDFTADNGKTVHRNLGEALGIVGDGQNITTATDPTNGKISVGLSDELSIGTKGADGKDGSIGINGKDGSSVVINGKDGSIGLTGPTGADGTPGKTITIKGLDGKNGVNGVDGSTVDRIVVNDQTVATLNDGQKYAGDNGQNDETKVIAKKLNEQLDIVGGADATKLTENNIGVNNVNGQLKVQLAQNINLGSNGSVTIGDTVVNNSGLTIVNGPSVTNSGINAGGSKIANVAPGEISATSTDAVNGSQLNDVKTLAGKHTVVTVEGGTAAGTTDYAGTNLQLKAIDNDGQTTYDLKLADNLSVGGKDGKDGSIGINGKDGSSVVINGKDGISVKGADGKDGVTISGKDGVDGVDGAEGHIGLNGKDGMTDIYTTPGQPGVNGKDGETMTRIIYTDPNGANHEVATLDDGMKFGGDSGTTSSVKLNKQLNVVGGESDSTKLADGNNIGVVSSQDGENGKLEVKLAKDLTGLDSVTTGDTVVNNDGVKVGDTSLTKEGLTIANGPSITNGGINAGGSKIANVAPGEISATSTDAVNGSQLNDVKTLAGKHTVVTVEGGTAAGTTDYAGTNLQLKATDNNGQTTYDLKLADNLSVGGKDGKDGSIGVNGKDGSSVVINGKDGSIGLTGPTGADGTPGKTITIKGLDGKDGVSGVNGVDGSTVDRIVVNNQTVATMNDGQKYAGDNGQTDTTKVIAKKLNEQLDIVGGADADKLTENNIGVNNVEGKLKVQLVKDVNLGVTGSLTAGTAVLGNQTKTTAGGVSQTGTYLTGLDNTSWNTANPDAVSGRAATEDQLKALNDKVNNISIGTGSGTFGLTDDNGTTVKQDLNRTITVKGGVTEGTVTTENTNGVSNITTAVKDGALEISLNKDIDLGTNGSVTTGNTVINNNGVTVGDTAITKDGLTINNGPSVTNSGINAGSKQISNVASGSDGVDADKKPTYNTDTNAANIGDVKNITNTAVDGAKTEITNNLTNKGLNFTADKGETVHRNLGEALGIVGDGQNITTTADSTNGKISVGLSDELSIGTKGADGKDGSIGINGKDGSSVVINGKDGISIKGADGKDGVTINGKDGVDGVNGLEGHIGLNGKDGVTDIWTTPGQPALNGKDGESMTRIIYKDPDGQNHEVATLDDGMKFGGDSGTPSAVKLNKQLNVVGGETDSTKLADGNNIGVVSSQDGENGKLEVKLAKDLTGLDSVTTGNTVINNNGVKVGDTAITKDGLTINNGSSVTNSGINAGGNKITNVANGTDNSDAVNVSQLTGAKTEITNKGLNFTADSGETVHRDLGEALGIVGDGQNITTATDPTNGKISIGLSSDLTIGAKDGADGTNGVDGKIGVNGKDGFSVVINGKDGSIGLTGPTGADGTPGKTITIKGLDGKDGVNGVDGSTVDRIAVNDQTVATMNDGQKYAGDNGQNDTTKVIAKKLNGQLDIIGGADADKLTENNIGVNNVDGKLKVQLVKDVNLGDTGSLTAGTAVLGNQTKTTAGGVSQTGTYLTGLGNTSWNTTNPDAVSGRAATEDQLKALNDKVNNISTSTGGGEFGLTADSGDAVKQNLGETIQIAGDDSNITTTADPNGKKITVALSDDLSIGAKNGADGKDGKDGSIGVNGKDGSSVAINGKDGISIKGADGKDGVTINGKDGVDGLEGHIGLNGKNGMTDIWTTPGQPGVNGKDGESMTRIVYTDPNGQNHEVATLDDGMKYGGDFGDASAVKLNNQVNVKGNAKTEANLTDGNIGVVSGQEGDNGLLTIKLNKDLNLTDKGSVTMGNTVINNSGVTINNGTTTVSLTDGGLDNGGNKITNVAKGTNANDAVNYSQLKDVETLAGKHTIVTVEGGTAAGTETYSGTNLQLKETTTDGQKSYDLKLADTISIGAKNGADGKDGKDGSIGVNGKDGASVVINGKDGSIGLTGPAGTDGTDGKTITIKGLDGKDGVNGVDGKSVDRIVVNDQTVATMNDGMKYGGDFGNTSKVKLNNQVNVKGNAKTEADLTDGNIGVVSSQEGDNGQLLIKLNKDLNLTDKGSVTMGNTVINNSGVIIGDGTSAVSLTDKGLNNGGNQITNVASGTTGKTYDTTKDGQANWNNAANIGDLNTAINDIKGQANGGFGLTADDGKSVKQDLGSTITVIGDKNIETKVTDDGKLQVGLKDNVDLGQKGSITAGNTTIDKGGVATNKITVKDSGISIDKDGINAGNTVIKDVGSGLGNDYDTTVEGQENWNNGANIGDIHTIVDNATEASKAKSGKNITVDKDNKVNLNDNITLGDKNDTSKQVNVDGNGATVTAGSGDNQVKMDGSKGQISAGGAVLGNQENTAGDKNPANGSYLNGLDNTKWDGQNIQSGRAATEDQLKAVNDKITGARVFEGDDGTDNKVTVGLGDTLKLNGGADTSKLSDGNIGVVKNANGDGLDIKLAKDLAGLDSVTTGNTTINSSGITIKTVDADRNITLQDSNINMGNNVVSGVADGVVAPGSTDAINGSQLAQRDQAISNLGGAVNKLDNRINKVGAGAAALAALHPQDFDPDDKWDFAFGYGHYNGANAGALGAFYKPNEDTTFSIGGTIGGGENMINAGVSFKLGQGNNVSNSRVGVAKEVRDLRAGMAKLEELVNNQNAVINRQSELINQLTGQNPGRLQEENSELFPDVPDNHWAYEYVTKLHELGIIEGYPDGTFGGDRMMTRYEFATIVYRAIMAGAASNAALKGDNTLSRLAKEFSPELKYIRIDTVRKDKDGNPTIQRVRIVPENKDKY